MSLQKLRKFNSIHLFKMNYVIISIQTILRRFTVDVVIVLLTTSERTPCIFLNQTFMAKEIPPSLYKVRLFSL